MSTPLPFAALLTNIKEAFNEALRNEKQNVPEHIDHLPFEFDFAESNIPNAFAIPIGGRSVICVTMPLVYLLWETCVQMSKSETVTALLGVPAAPERQDLIHALMFRTQLAFVVSHEFTHHVHGHAPQSSLGPPFFNEVLVGDDTGGLESQAFEIDADGYAVYHVLAHLFDGPGRTQAVELLGCGEAQIRAQDEVLFASFVMAVGAFLFVQPPGTLDPSKIYKRSHPPQSARMNWIMHAAIGWCQQNRPDLATWITKDRFQMLMRAVAAATWGMNGGTDWSDQTAFLLSEPGSEYVKKLDECVKKHIKSL